MNNILLKTVMNDLSINERAVTENCFGVSVGNLKSKEN